VGVNVKAVVHELQTSIHPFCFFYVLQSMVKTPKRDGRRGGIEGGDRSRPFSPLQFHNHKMTTGRDPPKQPPAFQDAAGIEGFARAGLSHWSAWRWHWEMTNKGGKTVDHGGSAKRLAPVKQALGGELLKLAEEASGRKAKL
jgi:hypothetical protein